MTGQADFSTEEWELLLEAPPLAGTMVALAHRGGSFRESFSMAKAYTEARREPGQSELLDTIVATKPKVERPKQHSYAELETHALEKLGDAVALLSEKATPEELAGYRGFVVSLAERVAAAHEEGGEAVAESERAAIDKITAAIGG
jgi:hypothetical protein